MGKETNQSLISKIYIYTPKILLRTIRAIIEMPNSLRWLCITHCLCWMSLLCFSLYFTDFVGEEVFGMFVISTH